MLAVYEKNYYLRTSDFDCHGRIKPAAVLEMFQDAAGEHAGVLGCGFKQLAPRELMWVLMRTKFELCAQPAMFDTVRIKTWPCPPARVGYRRDYGVYSHEGELIAKGSSDWVLLDAESRTLVTNVSAYPEDCEFLEERSFPGRLERLRPFEAQEEGFTIVPGYSRLDINGHVNNTAYADFVLDACGEKLSGKIKAFQIDYRRELKYGSAVTVNKLSTEDGMLFSGTDAEGEISFLGRVICEE